RTSNRLRSDRADVHSGQIAANVWWKINHVGSESFVNHNHDREVMRMFDWLNVLQDPNARWILFGSMLLGLSSGVIGSFAYLRKQSLMGDALSHAALPGVCIAFMLSGSKSIFLFLLGAAAAGIAATFGIGFITRHTRIKQDSALAIVLTVFFGFGIV